jgi:hypothetical protein
MFFEKLSKKCIFKKIVIMRVFFQICHKKCIFACFFNLVSRK